MSVHQTREHFLRTQGEIVDNPKIGPAITEAYWRPGNSSNFLDLVQSLTGKPLSGAAWVHELLEPIEEKIKNEKEAYEKAVRSGKRVHGDLDLGMRIRITDGDAVIADSKDDGSFMATNEKFEAFVKRRRTEGKP